MFTIKTKFVFYLNIINMKKRKSIKRKSYPPYFILQVPRKMNIITNLNSEHFSCTNYLIFGSLNNT